MTKKDEEEMFSRIEAEQSAIGRLIEESRRLSARTDALLGAARKGKSKEAEGEMEES